MSEMRMPSRKCEKSEVPQQMEVTGVKIEKTKKKIAIAAIVLLSVILLAVAVVQGKKKQRKQQKEMKNILLIWNL